MHLSYLKKKKQQFHVAIFSSIYKEKKTCIQFFCRQWADIDKILRGFRHHSNDESFWILCTKEKHKNASTASFQVSIQRKFTFYFPIAQSILTDDLKKKNSSWQQRKKYQMLNLNLRSVHAFFFIEENKWSVLLSFSIFPSPQRIPLIPKDFRWFFFILFHHH